DPGSQPRPDEGCPGARVGGVTVGDQALLELVLDASVHRVERQGFYSGIGPGFADGGGRSHGVAEDPQVHGMLDALGPVDDGAHVLLLQDAERGLRASAPTAVSLVEGDEVEVLMQAWGVIQDP